MKSEHWSLSQRTKLAHRFAESVLCLYAAEWLHKGIHSDGIVFFPSIETKELELTEPHLASFGYLTPVPMTRSLAARISRLTLITMLTCILCIKENALRRKATRIPFASLSIYTASALCFSRSHSKYRSILFSRKSFPHSQQRTLPMPMSMRPTSGRMKLCPILRQVLLSEKPT